MTKLGEGWDNIVYDINGELVVRLSKAPDGQARSEAVAREVAILAAVGAAVDLKVPEIVFSDPPAGLVAYRKLAGIPLNPGAADPAVAAQLAGFLRQLHTVPMAGLARQETRPIADALDWAHSCYVDVAALVPGHLVAPVERWLAAPPPEPSGHHVLCHNDFSAEHILLNPATFQVSGIIDWSDAMLTDPARDLALLLRDLGPAFFTALCDGYGADPAAIGRARYFARCTALHDIAHGARNSIPRDLDKGLSALNWLFA